MTAIHGHGAAHGSDSRAQSRKRLALAIGITAAVLVTELVGGLMSGSLALLSDAGHVLTDLLALALSYAAIWIAGRPADPRRSFGYHRVEILAALLNGALLLVIAAGIVRESYARLFAPVQVRGGVMITVAALGLAGNIASMVLLAPARRTLGVRGAWLHVVGDTLSSVAVLGAGFAVIATGWTSADALAGAVIAVVIVIGAVGLLKESVDVLLEACPVGIDGARVERRIRELPEVGTVHDLHIWSITSGMHALSGHVVLRAGQHSTDALLARLQAMLLDEFQIAHTTFQIESHAFEEIGQIH